jgi:hypothetical protein
LLGPKVGVGKLRVACGTSVATPRLIECDSNRKESERLKAQPPYSEMNRKLISRQGVLDCYQTAHKELFACGKAKNRTGSISEQDASRKPFA